VAAKRPSSPRISSIPQLLWGERECPRPALWGCKVVAGQCEERGAPREASDRTMIPIDAGETLNQLQPTRGSFFLLHGSLPLLQAVALPADLTGPSGVPDSGATIAVRNPVVAPGASVG
jgi:hypothetical protein